MSESLYNVRLEGAEDVARRFNLAADRVRTIAFQSVNREAATFRTRLTRFVRDEVRLSSRYVLGRVNIKPAVLAAGQPEAEVTASQDNVLLSRYDVQPKDVAQARTRGGARRPVSVFVSDDGGRKELARAFLIRLRGSGATAVAFRIKGENRIKVSYGPSVDQIFRTWVETTPALAESEARLRRELTRRLGVDFGVAVS